MEPLLHLFFVIKVSALFFTTDNLQNIYAVTDDFKIVKYDSSGQLLHTYANKSLGQPTSLDVSNPMKLMLYYKDFSTIVWLDNTLSEIAETNLAPIEIIQSPVACLSADGNFWVYDEVDQRLKKFDTQLHLVKDGAALQNFSDQPLQPIQMKEEDQQLYVSDTSQGIFVFDQYGSFSNKILIKKASDFQVENNQLFYLKENKVQSYNFKTLETFSVTLPDEAKQVRLEAHFIYLLQKNQIAVYPY